MARDFFVRLDLQRMGAPERLIRVLEKVTLLIQALEDERRKTKVPSAFVLRLSSSANI